jgi:hypothetical protein
MTIQFSAPDSSTNKCWIVLAPIMAAAIVSQPAPIAFENPKWGHVSKLNIEGNEGGRVSAICVCTCANYSTSTRTVICLVFHCLTVLLQ